MSAGELSMHCQFIYGAQGMMMKAMLDRCCHTYRYLASRMCVCASHMHSYDKIRGAAMRSSRLVLQCVLVAW